MAASSPSNRKRKRPDDLFMPIADLSEHITVVVGKALGEAKTFTAPKATLLAKSDYFRLACTDRWQEGQEGIVHLDDIDPTLYNSFQNWILGGKVVVEKEMELLKYHHVKSSDQVFQEACRVSSQVMCDWVRLYVVADRLQSTGLKRMIRDKIEDIVDFTSIPPQASEVVLCYKSLVPSSRLRHLFSHLCQLNYKPEYMNTVRKDMPLDFWVDVAMQLKQKDLSCECQSENEED